MSVDFKGAFDTVWRKGAPEEVGGLQHPTKVAPVAVVVPLRPPGLRPLERGPQQDEGNIAGVPKVSPLSPLMFLLFVASRPAAIQDASPGCL